MRLFKSLFGDKPDDSGPALFTARTKPARPLYVIGDVHGRYDLLTRMLDRLADDREADSDLVFVGDLVDRGDDTASVLATVKDIVQDPSQNAFCLKGNHEAMLLEFLDDPTGQGRRWVRFGGLETLWSFDIRQVTDRSEDDVLIAARDVLAETIPQETQDWMRNLPLKFDSGNITVVHAAADPDKPMDQQLTKVLMWGHDRFDKTFRKDGRWVIHGHTITEEPYAFSGRINVDTGAYASGVLTCVKVVTDDVEFISVGA